MAEKSYFEQLTELVEINNEDKYFKALGRFIHEYSRVENIAHVLLARKAGINMKTANALLSGFRASDTGDLLRRLAEAATESRGIHPELEEAFSQLKIVNTARNEIFHNGAHVKAGDQRWVTNRTKAVSKAKVTFRAVSPVILEQMTQDALKLYAVFLLHASPDQGEIRSLYPELEQPWLYKPEPQGHQGQGGHNQKARPKSGKRQRGASQQ